MKALIFAAGLGTRLGAITRTMPKALVEVGGEPMLKRVIIKLKDAGISEMVVNIHHHADTIRDYLAVNHNFGANISISDESESLLDTGGGLLKAKELLGTDSPILLHNSDILTDFDIREMIETHLGSESDVTLLVAERQTTRYLLFDESMRMRGWTDLRTGEIRSPWTADDIADCHKLAFGGVHIVNPAIFKPLESFSREPKFSITPFYTASCRDLRISGFKPERPYNWIDIGKPESLKAAQNIASKLPPIAGEEY